MLFKDGLALMFSKWKIRHIFIDLFKLLLTLLGYELVSSIFSLII